MDSSDEDNMLDNHQEIADNLYDLFGGKLSKEIISMVVEENEDQNTAYMQLQSMLDQSAEGTSSSSNDLPISSSMVSSTSKNKKEVKLEKMNNKLSRDSKTLILMRGLPGSGKTYKAQQLCGDHGTVLSTDDYFKRHGTYKFEYHLLQRAHFWNQSRAQQAVDGGTSPIIIDNTNMQLWEMKPYIKMASKNNYAIQVEEPDTYWAWDTNRLASINTRGITKDKLEKMKDRYEKFDSIENIVNPASVQSGSSTVVEKLPISRGMAVHDDRDASIVASFLDSDGFSSWRKEQAQKQKSCPKEQERNQKTDTLHGYRRKGEISGAAASSSGDCTSRITSSYNSLGNKINAGSQSNKVMIDLTSDSSGENMTEESDSNLKFLAECFPNFELSYCRDWLKHYNGDLGKTCDHFSKCSNPGKLPSSDEGDSITDDEHDIPIITSGKAKIPRNKYKFDIPIAANKQTSYGGTIQLLNLSNKENESPRKKPRENYE